MEVISSYLYKFVGGILVVFRHVSKNVLTERQLLQGQERYDNTMGDFHQAGAPTELVDWRMSVRWPQDDSVSHSVYCAKLTSIPELPSSRGSKERQGPCKHEHSGGAFRKKIRLHS